MKEPPARRAGGLLKFVFPLLAKFFRGQPDRTLYTFRLPPSSPSRRKVCLWREDAWSRGLGRSFLFPRYSFLGPYLLPGKTFGVASTQIYSISFADYFRRTSEVSSAFLTDGVCEAFAV